MRNFITFYTHIIYYYGYLSRLGRWLKMWNAFSHFYFSFWMDSFLPLVYSIAPATKQNNKMVQSTSWTRPSKFISKAWKLKCSIYFHHKWIYCIHQNEWTQPRPTQRIESECVWKKVFQFCALNFNRRVLCRDESANQFLKANHKMFLIRLKLGKINEVFDIVSINLPKFIYIHLTFDQSFTWNFFERIWQ